MSAPDFSVAGQHVLISGGAGGIGTAFARAFRDSGASVIVCDIEPNATDEGFPFERLDVRDDSAVEALASRIDTLDVLIHCAGRLIRHEEHKPGCRILAPWLQPLPRSTPGNGLPSWL